MKPILPCLLLFFSLVVYPGRAAGELEEVDVFVMAGQSNMMGQGTTVAGLPDGLQCEQKDLFFVDLFNHEGTWRKMDPPNTTRYGSPPAEAGFGPEILFARTVANKTGRRVFIFKWALGAQNLDKDFLGKDRLYDWMAGNRAKIGKDLAERFGARPRYRAFLWMQGESDANAEMAPRYLGNLKKLFERVRSDFGANLPVIIGRISDFTDSPDWMMVREAQVEWAEGDPDAWWVDTDALEVFPDDRIHFNNEGMVGLGKAFAETYLRNVAEADGD